MHKEYIYVKHTFAHVQFCLYSSWEPTFYKIYMTCGFHFLPSSLLYTTLVSCCVLIKSVLTESIFFCLVFAFCKICKNWLHFFVHFPYLLLCLPRFRFLAFEWNGSARSPVSSVRSLSTMGAFSAGLTSIPQPFHTGCLPSHPDSATLKFSSSSLPFPESCVVHVHSAGLNLHRSRLGFKMCTKMPGLTALGSKNCFVSSPGTLLSFFSFSYCHLWLWQPTLQSRLLFKF